MPIYEYRCTKCGHEFEMKRSFSESADLPRCPECGGPTEKLISAFGSKVGFYLRAPSKPFRQSGRTNG